MALSCRPSWLRASSVCVSDQRHGSVHGTDGTSSTAAAAAAASSAAVAATGRWPAEQSPFVGKRRVCSSDRLADACHCHWPRDIDTTGERQRRASMKLAGNLPYNAGRVLAPVQQHSVHCLSIDNIDNWWWNQWCSRLYLVYWLRVGVTWTRQNVSKFQVPMWGRVANATP